MAIYTLLMYGKSGLNYQGFASIEAKTEAEAISKAWERMEKGSPLSAEKVVSPVPWAKLMCAHSLVQVLEFV